MKNGLWGRPLLPEILGQTDPILQKMTISNPGLKKAKWPICI